MNMDELLQKCCFTENYKGYHALRQCILIAHQDENKLSAYRKLYLEAAPAVHSNPVCMERNMRTMIKHAWNSGGGEQLRLIAGSSVLDRRPTVSETIEMFVYFINDHPGLVTLEHHQESLTNPQELCLSENS